MRTKRFDASLLFGASLGPWVARRCGAWTSCPARLLEIRGVLPPETDKLAPVTVSPPAGRDRLIRPPRSARDLVPHGGGGGGIGASSASHHRSGLLSRNGDSRTERLTSYLKTTMHAVLIGVDREHLESYAFEKGAEKLAGGDGFADVWKRGHFAWEYKGKLKDLKAAYRQLNDYRETLGNPPLLVVRDLDRFEVHVRKKERRLRGCAAGRPIRISSVVAFRLASTRVAEVAAAAPALRAQRLRTSTHGTSA